MHEYCFGVNMDKRYQIFVSSTFNDLQEERAEIAKILHKMKCIASGMEYFPAIDEEQLSYIKREIDYSDYYVLIIGGRYGSVALDGISYTEKEYDYAVSIGRKVIALIHSDPDSIPVGKSEITDTARTRLREFRQKAASERLVVFWNTKQDLYRDFQISLYQTINDYPEVGWVRADKVSNLEHLEELIRLKDENQKLKETIAESKKTANNKIGLASLDDSFTIKYKYRHNTSDNYLRDRSIDLTWREIFDEIAPHLIETPNDFLVRNLLKNAIRRRKDYDYKSMELEDYNFKTISVQLIALGLISQKYLKTTNGGMALFWLPTDEGNELMLQTRVVKKSPTE